MEDVAVKQKQIVSREPAKWSVAEFSSVLALFDERAGGVALFHQQGDVKYSDGSTGLSLRVPMLAATGYLAEQREVLEKIAAVLNDHFRGDSES